MSVTRLCFTLDALIMGCQLITHTMFILCLFDCLSHTSLHYLWTFVRKFIVLGCHYYFCQKMRSHCICPLSMHMRLFIVEEIFSSWIGIFVWADRTTRQEWLPTLEKNNRKGKRGLNLVPDINISIKFWSELFIVFFLSSCTLLYQYKLCI